VCCASNATVQHVAEPSERWTINQMMSNASDDELLRLGLAFILRWDMRTPSHVRFAVTHASELELSPEEALKAVRIAERWLADGHVPDLVRSGVCQTLRNGSATSIRRLPSSLIGLATT
jgi:hypothetical protein